jgi:F-type H+-transporting ATPase subunit c
MIKARLFVMSFMMVLLTVATAAAQNQVPTGGSTSWFFPNDAAFAVAIAALGGAMGDGKAIAAACEGTARNPGAGGRIFTMLILGLALIETLVLFTFLTLFIKPVR